MKILILNHVNLCNKEIEYLKTALKKLRMYACIRDIKYYYVIFKALPIRK